MSDIPPPTVPPATPPPPGGGSYVPPPPPPAGSAPGGSDRTLMVVLSYLGLLALIPLLTKKDDPEVQWHAKNGLALAIVWFVVWIAFQVIAFILPGPIRLVWGGIGCIIGVAFFVVNIIALVKGVGGQRFRIPVVTDLAEKM
jgi:uncharacterized membrane protein